MVKIKSSIETTNLETPVKTKRRKLRHSNFFVTINPNKRFETGFEKELKPYVNKFKGALHEVFDETNIEKYITIKEGDDFEKDLKEISIEVKVERGSSNKTIHAHALVKVAHYSNVKMDYGLMKSTIIDELDVDNIHLYSRVFQDSSASLQEYINKNK